MTNHKQMYLYIVVNLVDGQWGTWGPWTSCSKSCGIGTLLRYRNCNNPAPVGNGAKCVGNGTQTHECSLGACAGELVNGSFFIHSVSPNVRIYMYMFQSTIKCMVYI